jgi:hypothetical protein
MKRKSELVLDYAPYVEGVLDIAVETMVAGGLERAL